MTVHRVGGIFLYLGEAIDSTWRLYSEGRFVDTGEPDINESERITRLRQRT